MASSARQAATFLETVAAIVIQTAYRRYLAIEFVQYLREEADEVELRRKQLVQDLLLAKEDNGVHKASKQQRQQRSLGDSSGNVSNGNRHRTSVDVQCSARGYSNNGPSGQQQSLSSIHSPARLSPQTAQDRHNPSDTHLQSKEVSDDMPRAHRSHETGRWSESRDIANYNNIEQSQTGTLFASNTSVIKKERIHDVYVLAAIRIQAAFRGFWTRDSLNVDHYCAGIIQKSFRKHLHMRNYLFIVSRVVFIQSIWRRSIARDLAATLLGAAILIQAFVRGFLTRKLLLGKSLCDSTFYPAYLVEEEARAATLIQASYRRFASEKRYICALVDVLIVQTVVRRWLAGRQVQELRQGINKSKIAAALKQQRGAVPLSETPSVKSYWQSRQQNG